ncbi:MAG: hypothetical protein ACREUA_11200 [Burkholderiales bacterium]
MGSNPTLSARSISYVSYLVIFRGLFFVCFCAILCNFARYGDNLIPDARFDVVFGHPVCAVSEQLFGQFQISHVGRGFGSQVRDISSIAVNPSLSVKDKEAPFVSDKPGYRS